MSPPGPRGLRVALVAAFAASLSASPRLVRAEDCDAAHVAKLKKDGNAAFGAGNLEEALGAYEKAYACDKDPSLLFNMSKADQRLGRPAEALRFMRRFESESKGLPKEITDAADAAIAELVTQVGNVTVKTNVEGATVSIDGREVGTAPVASLEVDPGTFTIRVVAPGKTAVERRVVVAAGKHVDVDGSFVVGQADETKPEPTKAPSSFRPHPLLWAGVAVAGVGLVVGAGTGGASLAETSDIKKSCTGNLCPASTASARKKASALANVSNVSFAVAGVGAVLGAVGLGLGFSSKPTSEPTASVRLGPTGVSFEGVF